MSGTQDIRARMSVNRIIMDEQATKNFAHHEANQQAPELQESALNEAPGRKHSRQQDPLKEAAQALLSLAQSPRPQDEVPKVDERADDRAQIAPSSIDRPSWAMDSTSTDHVRAQGRSPRLNDAAFMDPPPTDRALVEAPSPHIDLPTTNFQSINKVRSQARSFSTVSTTQLPSTVHAGAAATNSSSVLVTRLERLGHGKSKVKSEGIGRPKLRTSKPNPKNIINGGDPQHREFECTYGNPCKLGQYTKDLSRKMVSDYFGRNKKATAMIEGKWIVSCRKHYQRLSYQESWPSMKANIVRSQLAEIEAIEPGMPWHIKLKNSEEKRLTRYLHACAQSGTVPDWTAPASVCVPDDKKQSSLAVLHSLSAFCGANKTKKDCDDAITSATAALSAGRATHFPLFEMIPQFSALGKRKRSDSPASDEERPDKAKGGRPRKKSRSEDEQDDFVEVDDHDEDDSEDEDFVMENAESDSEGS